MTPQLSRREFVACLIELINVALNRGSPDDAAAVLAGVRVLRPKLVELDIMEGWVLIKNGRFHESVQVLRNLESSPTHWSMAKAMMAMCQQYLQDPEWQISANEVLDGNSSPDAVAMVKELKARHEKKRAPGFPEEAATAEASPSLPMSFQSEFQYPTFAVHLRA
jgi:type III secretion protein HrpB1